MNPRLPRLLTVVSCAALIIAMGAAAQAREFHSSTGTIRIEAEVAAFDGKIVRLALVAGILRDVPIDRLSTADQEYLKKTYPDGLNPELIAAGLPKVKGKDKAKGGEKGKAGASGEKPSFKVDLIGVSVAKSIQNLPPDALPMPIGTHVLLMVSNPVAEISGVNAKKSKISSFTANKGTDLTEGASGEVFEFIPLPDNKTAMVHIHHAEVPAAKSVRATLKGVLHLAIGGDENETVAVPLNFEVLLGL